MPRTQTRPDLSEFLTTKQVADMYGVAQRQVQYAIKNGYLEAQQVGGYTWLIWQHDLPETWPVGK